MCPAITAEMVAAYFEQRFRADPQKYIAGTTVQFHWIADGKVGMVASSGAIILVHGQKYVVTVLHGAKRDIGLLCKEAKTGRIAIFEPPKYPVILSKKLTNDGGRGDPFVDFTFFPLPDEYIPVRNVNFECFAIGELPALPIESLPVAPNFSVGGSIPFEDSDSNPIAEFKVIMGLTPVAPIKHPYIYFSTAGSMVESNVAYNGLSGAPIVNECGVPVALMCGSCDEDEFGNKIPLQFWGISTNHVVEIIEAAIENELPKFQELPGDERERLATRALELGSYFYNNDREVKDLLWK